MQQKKFQKERNFHSLLFKKFFYYFDAYIVFPLISFTIIQVSQIRD